ncbi:MAG: PTS transporter subunit EIIC [Clostridia bacterium]|nr:PTS transporter subunit EIIC [Clostridia bacterium]
MSKTKEKRGGVFGVLQRVGRSFMLPIALLPIAGLLLGIGSSFTNPAMIQAYHLEKLLGEGTVLHFVLTVMSETGNIIFGNLPILFAMGVALGMAENEKATATLSAAIAFFVMHQTISTLLRLTGGFEGDVLEGTVSTVVGIRSLEMGVFGGIIVGLGVAWLHNRFYKIKLPSVISFFGGVRFVPIISTLAYILVGVGMFFLWPMIQKGIFSLGDFVLESGYAGTFLYGVIERALIPFGLHHVFYLPFWQTGLGGSAMIDGVLVSGAQNIFFAELASPSTQVFSVSATRFMSGKFPLMIFGLPGAALAMYWAAKPEKRKIAGGLLLSAAVTSMLTGITEPLEFTFLFVAPLLYVIHCVFAGAAYMLMHLFNVGVGMTFSGGLIDLTLFGILQGNAKTNWVWVVVVGLAYFAVYWFLFYVLIKKRNYMTPGREEESETRLYTRADYNEKKDAAAKAIPVDVASAQAGEDGGAISDGTPDEGDSLPAMIVRGLGGKDNIRNLDACATRLRVTVVDPAKVNDGLLRATGASGVIRKGEGVQIIYGPRVTVIKSEVEEYLN